jgi:hypothetical protein
VVAPNIPNVLVVGTVLVLPTVVLDVEFVAVFVDELVDVLVVVFVVVFVFVFEVVLVVDAFI